MTRTVYYLRGCTKLLAVTQCVRVFMLPICLALTAAATLARTPESWIPARWDGGPLDLERRAKDKAVTGNALVREAIANWYQPATLSLLESTPINCLLVTFSANAGAEVEIRQHQLVKQYARAARERGIAVMGIVYSDTDQEAVAKAADEAHLDGLVLDAAIPAGTGFAEKLEAALRSRNNQSLVIPIAKEAASIRRSKMPVLAVNGVRPSARDLADMGIRAGPSAEPWIESNIWLVRSFRLGTAWQPVWINQEPNPGSQGDYARCVADSAVAGGRWIVTLDDDLRAGLFHKNPDALASWKRIGSYLKFAEDHAEWRRFAPYGNLGIILDTAGDRPDISDEYLNLVARRQVPYRIIERSQLTPEVLASFQAVLAAALSRPSEAERSMLRIFAEKGGLVVIGPSWGNPPKDSIYEIVALGLGRVAVYKDDPPDPESAARDMLDLLEPEVMGLTAFNVPSVLTYVSTSDSGKRALIQLLNYATSPFDARITLRFNGNYKTARLYTPENAPLDLATRATGTGRTEVAIPRIAVWGAVLLE